MLELTHRTALHRLRERINQLKTVLDLPCHLVYSGLHDQLVIRLSRELEIDIVEENLLPHDEGKYIPANPPLLHRPRIVIDPRIGNEERLNFTFFHEVTHHLIRSDDILYEFLHELAPGKDFGFTIERFCHNGAAEFLISLNDVRKYIEEAGFSIRLVEQLDKQYGASRPATCIQLAQAAGHKCVTVVCEYGIMLDRSEGEQHMLPVALGTKRAQLYILYSSSSPSFKYTPGRFIPVPNHHILAEALRNHCFVRGRDTILFKRAKGWPADCEAFYYGGRVYGAFNQTPPRPPVTIQPRLPII